MVVLLIVVTQFSYWIYIFSALEQIKTVY